MGRSELNCRFAMVALVCSIYEGVICKQASSNQNMASLNSWRASLTQAPGAVSNQTTERGKRRNCSHECVLWDGHNFLNRGNSLNYLSCQ